MLAYRFKDALYCRKHWPGKRLIIEESKIVKPHAVIVRVCAQCNKPFVREVPAKPVAGPEQRFRAVWAEEVAEGKALPIAGDLLDKIGEGT